MDLGGDKIIFLFLSDTLVLVVTEVHVGWSEFS